MTLHVLTSMWFTCDRIKDETTMHIDLSSIDSDFQPQAKEFWRLALPKQEWMNRHGRHIECNDEQNRLSIRMTPNKTVIPLPHPDLKLVCAFHALKCFFTSIAAQTTQPCLPVVFKWEGYVIWKGQLPACTHMVWLRAVIQVFTDSITNRTDLSFVAFGTRIGDENTFEQIMQRASPNRPPRHLLIVMAPLVSGGGAKTEWDTQIRNQPSHPKHDLVILIPRWKFDQSQPRRSFVNSDAFKASCIGIVNWINIPTFVKPHGINCNWNGMLFSEPRGFISRFHLGFVTR